MIDRTEELLGQRVDALAKENDQLKAALDAERANCASLENAVNMAVGTGYEIEQQLKAQVAALQAQLAVPPAVEALLVQWETMTANAFKEGPIPNDETGHTARWTMAEMMAAELRRALFKREASQPPVDPPTIGGERLPDLVGGHGQVQVPPLTADEQRALGIAPKPAADPPVDRQGPTAAFDASAARTKVREWLVEDAKQPSVAALTALVARWEATAAQFANSDDAVSRGHSRRAHLCAAELRTLLEEAMEPKA